MSVIVTRRIEPSIHDEHGFTAPQLRHAVYIGEVLVRADMQASEALAWQLAIEAQLASGKRLGG